MGQHQQFEADRPVRGAAGDWGVLPDTSLTGGRVPGSRPERIQDTKRAFPPVVYLPCGPVPVGAGEVAVDVWPTRDGRRALLVYSALDRLVDACGPEQPWAVLPATALEQLRVSIGFEFVFLDLEIPEEHRRSGSAG